MTFEEVQEYLSEEDKKNRYNVFENSNPIRYSILFDNVEQGLYKIEQYSISRNGGSVYDAWCLVLNGGPSSTFYREVGIYGKNLSSFLYRSILRSKKRLELNHVLQPHEIILLKLKRMKSST